MSTKVNVTMGENGPVATTPTETPFVDKQPGDEMGVSVKTGHRARVGGDHIRAIFSGDIADEPTVEQGRTVRSGSITAQQRAEVQAAHPGILGTARSENGRPVMVGPDTDPKRTLVNVNGMETTLDNALRMGVVGRDSYTGGYFPGKGFEETPAPAPAAPSYGQIPEVQEMVDNAMAGIPELGAQNLMRKVLTGQEFTSADRSLLEGAGKNAEAAAEQIYAAGEAILRGLAIHLGVNAADESQLDQLVTVMTSLRPGYLNDGVVRAIHGDYSQLIHYIVNASTALDIADPTPVSIDNAKTRIAANGKQLVTIPGVGEIEVKVAKRLGML